MTILPGSLDYLYYNGILDHIPYEAYEYPPVSQSGNNVRQELGGVIGTPGSYMQSYDMNTGSAYMDSAMSGGAYQSYSSSNDSFSKSSNTNSNSVQNYSYHDEIMGSEGKELMASKRSGYRSQLDAKAGAEGHQSVRESVLGKDSDGKKRVMNKPLIMKGFVGALVMAGTLFLILRGKGAKRKP